MHSRSCHRQSLAHSRSPSEDARFKPSIPLQIRSATIRRVFRVLACEVVQLTHILDEQVEIKLVHARRTRKTSFVRSGFPQLEIDVNIIDVNIIGSAPQINSSKNLQQSLLDYAEVLDEPTRRPIDLHETGYTEPE